MVDYTNDAFENHPFTVVSWLDSGAFGDIYEVYSPLRGRRYAAKKITFRRREDEEPSIAKEIQALRRLQHRNIIALQDVRRYKQCVFIIEEIADLGNLQNFTESGGLSRLPESTRGRFCWDMVVALSFCHRRNICHLDINPTNILVVSGPVVKLGDFGQAVLNTDDSTVEEYLGMVNYQAPEVLKQEPYAPCPADVWSIACVVCYVINGCHLFSGSQSQVTNQQYNLKNCILNIFTNPANLIKNVRLRWMLDAALKLAPKSRPNLRTNDFAML